MEVAIQRNYYKGYFDHKNWMHSNTYKYMTALS